MKTQIIQAPWALTKLAEALARSPGAIRTAMCRGTFPLKPCRIMGRIYFDADDVRTLLCSNGSDHA